MALNCAFPAAYPYSENGLLACLALQSPASLCALHAWYGIAIPTLMHAHWNSRRTVTWKYVECACDRMRVSLRLDSMSRRRESYREAFLNHRPESFPEPRAPAAAIE